MYDARGGGSANNNGTMFAVALCGVVAAAFATVVFWPSGTASNDLRNQVAERSSVASNLFSGKEEKKFVQALKILDDGAYADLEKRISQTNLSAGKRHEVFMEAAQEVSFDHIDALARSDVKHMDVLMDEIISGLQTASRSRAKLCKGSTYASLQGMNQLQIGAFMEREIASNAELQEFSIKLNRRFLEAAIDGKKNPKNYGKFNANDKRAIDGLGMKLMSDPKIMRVMMAASSSSNPEAVLAKMDFLRSGCVRAACCRQTSKRHKSPSVGRRVC